MQCWFWNIDVSALDYFTQEIEAGRLRQGWGYEPDLDLRKIRTKWEQDPKQLLPREQEAWVRCNPMILRMHKGDLVVVKNVPGREFLTIVEVTGDYEFDLESIGDYGHILPVQNPKRFHKRSSAIKAPFIRALTRERNPIRVTHEHHFTVESLYRMQDSPELTKPLGFKERLEACKKDLIETLKQSIHHRLEPRDVELLVQEMMVKDGLNTNYTAGAGEMGADVVSEVDFGYGLKSFLLAIQVKKSSGTYSTLEGIKQIETAFEQRGANAGLLVTTADELGEGLSSYVKELKKTSNVQVLYGEELHDRLLEVIAKRGSSSAEED
jgi:predicted Mrr-cat superfamily restriction endonuclease